MKELIKKQVGTDEYAIYLHANGTLICKVNSVYKNEPEYFESDFVKKVWFVKPREWTIKEYTEMLQEAKDLGASSDSIKEYLDTWSINEESFYNFNN